MTRAGCHLCEDAERALRELGHTAQLRDVESDPELERLYDWRVPVLISGDRVLLEGRIDTAAVLRTLGPAAPRRG